MSFKNFFSFAAIALASIFISCSIISNEPEDKEPKLVFTLPSNARSIDTAGKALTINLKGGTTQSKTVNLSETTTVAFDNIKVGKKIHAEAFIFNSDKECVYSGKSEEITIQEGENTAEMKLKHPESYTITLIANGGTFLDGETAREIHISSTITKAEELNLTFDKHIFKGWSSSSGGNVIFADGATLIPIEDITLYAVWDSTEKEAADGNSFISALNSIAEGGTIFLRGNIKLTKDVSISKKITIDGQGKYGIEINTNSVSFTGVTFQNGSGGRVSDWEEYKDRLQPFGMIYLSAHKTAVFTNCTFKNNTTSEAIGGGAIAIFGNASVVISNCTFTENKADHGGAIDIGGGDSVKITNCTFQNNSDNMGCDIYLGGSGATVSGSGNISDFANPYKYYDESKKCPALFTTTGEREGSQGGGNSSNVPLEENSETMTLEEFEAAFSTFTTTFATVTLTGNLTINTDYTLDRTNLLQITIYGQGKYHIIANNVTLSFANVRFENCYNSGFGGALDLNDCSSTFKNCEFINNSAYKKGAALNIAGWAAGEVRETTVTNCTFGGNKDNEGNHDINAGGQYTHLVLGGRNSSNNAEPVFCQSEVYNGHADGTWE